LSFTSSSESFFFPPKRPPPLEIPNTLDKELDADSSDMKGAAEPEVAKEATSSAMAAKLLKRFMAAK
jgi:hypothetical protein